MSTAPVEELLNRKDVSAPSIDVLYHKTILLPVPDDAHQGLSWKDNFCTLPPDITITPASPIAPETLSSERHWRGSQNTDALNLEVSTPAVFKQTEALVHRTRSFSAVPSHAAFSTDLRRTREGAVSSFRPLSDPTPRKRRESFSSSRHGELLCNQVKNFQGTECHN